MPIPPVPESSATLNRRSNFIRTGAVWGLLWLGSLAGTMAAVQVTTEVLPASGPSAETTFTNVPNVSRRDAAATAHLRILAGVVDPNSGGLTKLQDGRLPSAADAPGENFFFDAGTDGGRLLFDLGRLVSVERINTCSRHPGSRGPQVYRLYGSDGSGESFVERPQRTTDLARSGWQLLAAVDTRPATGDWGGEYRVRITDASGELGKFRYLLFDISPTEQNDPFGNTFYSEIDVIETGATEAATAAPYRFTTSTGEQQISVDTSEAPDLAEWVEDKLAPVLSAWYPRIVARLPSAGFNAPTNVTIVIRPADGVAYASGNRITANADWLRRELDREALGAIVHEAVHVVQAYGRSRRPGSQRPPGWLVEGIPDYLRFFLFEPQSHGADLIWLEGRRNAKLQYDQSYRITANFLDYVIRHHDAKATLLTQINAACRRGEYTDALWEQLTGKTLATLNEEWKQHVEAQLAARAGARLNTLTTAEQQAGWQSLFNGVDFTGWHNFKRDGVRPGWQVKEGLLICADPHDAGDLVTTETFAAFELQLEYNISKGGNSGIMYHVTDVGGAAWATGPEFQLEDNAHASDPQRCGWLYALYRPSEDPRTGQPIDATLPAGQWNQIRLVVTPDKCEHWINGVKYFEYQLGSDDFKGRVARSKFSQMPLFAQTGAGRIALQGDHGQISFRNLKIRRL
ncbi:MAG: DUF1080 domain-containing protein [Verrucomicrobiae bacterium]|nr:DUF1080 domain-containing protein [Verrucomicrobiae bacterium]